MKLIKLEPKPKEEHAEDRAACEQILSEIPENVKAIAIVVFTENGDTAYAHHTGDSYFGIIGGLDCLKDSIIRKYG